MPVSQAIITRLQTEAAASPELEVCGALVGANGVVSDVVPLTNRSPHPRSSYLIDAGDVLRLEQRATLIGHEIIGFYHSHPQGSAVPSDADLAQAFPGYTYLILGSDGRTRAWRLRDDRSGFDEVRCMGIEQPVDPES